MKPESYFTWEAKPTSLIAPDWRAPDFVVPRRRGVRGALSALAARLRTADSD
jgi:hypothetical protein